MTVSERILQLCKEVDEFVLNPYIVSIDIKFIRFLEKLADQDKYAGQYIRQIAEIVNNTHIMDLENHFRVYSKYAEAKSYVFLVRKGLRVEVLPDKGFDDKGNPDFKVSIENGCCFIEVKALQMADGIFNARLIAEKSFEERVKFDQKLRSDGSAFRLQVIDPHKSLDSKNAEKGDMVILINEMIDKFNNNFKPDQYARGDTMAMIFLSAPVFPIYEHQDVRFTITQSYDGPYRKPISGELWMAAFGKPDMPIYVAANSCSGANINGHMERQGILIENHEIKALSFYLQGMPPQYPEEVVGLYRSTDEHSIKSVVTMFTSHFNDEKGTESGRLCYPPIDH